MDSLAIAAALYQLEDDEDRMRSSVELFWALFRNDLTEEGREKLSFDPEAAVGGLDERLRELTERFTPPYVPDEPDDAEALFTAVHLQASLLALYLIRSAAGQGDGLFGYGEDTGLYARPLDMLTTRLRISMPRRGSPRRFPEVFAMSAWTIESLVERVGAELAEQREEYAEALARLAKSLMCAAPVGEINEAWEESENPEDLVDLARACPWRTFSRMVDSGTWFTWTLPWLAGPELPTQQAAHWFEALKAQPNKHDWVKLAATFNDLANEVLENKGLEDVEVDGWGWDYYWFRAGSWTENQLTADELRERNEAIEDERAEERLRAYFFDEAQWNALSEPAKNALILADRTWVSSRNKAQVLNSLRIATEDILYHGLWTGLVEWAKGQAGLDLHRLQDVQQYLKEHRYEAPGLAQYEHFLRDDGVERYLKDNRGLIDDNVAFIRKQSQQFKGLRESRRAAEHAPVASVGLETIRETYREFMGIGPKRPGILPELVRLLLLPWPPPK